MTKDALFHHHRFVSLPYLWLRQMVVQGGTSSNQQACDLLFLWQTFLALVANLISDQLCQRDVLHGHDRAEHGGAWQTHGHGRRREGLPSQLVRRRQRAVWGELLGVPQGQRRGLQVGHGLRQVPGRRQRSGPRREAVRAALARLADVSCVRVDLLHNLSSFSASNRDRTATQQEKDNCWNFGLWIWKNVSSPLSACSGNNLEPLLLFSCSFHYRVVLKACKWTKEMHRKIYNFTYLCSRVMAAFGLLGVGCSLFVLFPSFSS